VGRTSELYALHKDGHEFPIEISLGTWVTGEGRFFCGIIRDISERKALEEAYRHAALHDALTRLPNRILLARQLQHTSYNATASTLTALMMVDLDNFKSVNDEFGHQAGDAVLVSIAGRLKNAVRSTDVVARFGGDEFLIVVKDLANEIEAEEIAARLATMLSTSCAFHEVEIPVSASIGVALAQGNFETEALLREADRAMYTYSL
jgi:diguanylate cyclase (GGDEF)-like protein